MIRKQANSNIKFEEWIKKQPPEFIKRVAKSISPKVREIKDRTEREKSHPQRGYIKGRSSRSNPSSSQIIVKSNNELVKKEIRCSSGPRPGSGVRCPRCGHRF